MLPIHETIPVSLESHSVKRPFSDKAIGPLIKKTIGSSTFAKVLDVGFGELKRSTLALNQVVPNAIIHAIDNDVMLVNKLTLEHSGKNSKNVVYSFGDAELWLPQEEYDLIVICLTAHAFHNPFRAVCNLVHRNLKPNGHLLFIHRTDDLMRAAARLLSPSIKENIPSDIAAAVDAWTHIDTTWRTHQKEHIQLPWQIPFLCDHRPLITCCEHLGLEMINDTQEHYNREGAETLCDVFGTHEMEPQYQAPRYAWRLFRQNGLISEWPSLPKVKLNTQIKLQGVLYKKNSKTVARHTFFPIHATVPPKFTPLKVEAGASLDSDAIRDSIKSQLPAVLRMDTQDFFYIADNKITSFCKQVDTGEGLRKGESKTLLTDVLRRSEAIWRAKGTHDVLLLVFPTLAVQSQVFSEKAVGGLDALGLREGDLQIIPLVEDSIGLQRLLTRGGFAIGDIGELANYLAARGAAARNKQCAAIYYLIYRSHVLNSNRDYQAMCFWTKRWLGIESMMALMEFGYSFLIAMEEKRAIEALMELVTQKSVSEEHRSRLEETIRQLNAQIVNGQTLANLPFLIETISVKESDDQGLKHSYDKLGEALAKLLQRITGAALVKWGDDKAKVIEYLSPNIQERIQKKTKNRGGKTSDNPSILRSNFFNYIAGDKKRSDANVSIAKLKKSYTNNTPHQPEIKTWVENVVRLKPGPEDQK